MCLIPVYEDQESEEEIMSKILEVKNLVTKFYTLDGVVNAVNGVNFDLALGPALDDMEHETPPFDVRIGCAVSLPDVPTEAHRPRQHPARLLPCRP